MSRKYRLQAAKKKAGTKTAAERTHIQATSRGGCRKTTARTAITFVFGRGQRVSSDSIPAVCAVKDAVIGNVKHIVPRSRLLL